MAVKKAASGRPYRALKGLNFPPDVRVEPGEITEQIPGHAIKDLLAVGAIEKVESEQSKDDA